MSACEAWAEQITDPAQRGRAMDPDGDGFTNLQEFLLGTSPIAGNGSLTTADRTGGTFVIRWKQRASGATYQVMESTTLTDPWTPSGATITADGSQVGDSLPRKATLTIGSSKNFFRVTGLEN